LSRVFLGEGEKLFGKKLFSLPKPHPLYKNLSTGDNTQKFRIPTK